MKREILHVLANRLWSIHYVMLRCSLERIYPDALPPRDLTLQAIPPRDITGCLESNETHQESLKLDA